MTAVTFGLTLAIVLAELVLRVGGPAVTGRLLPRTYSLDQIDAAASGQVSLMIEPNLGWITTPSSNQGHNRQGLRADSDYTPVPGPGIRRFAAYGDSFTYCAEVSLDNCWTHRLENLAPRAEALNFGVPAYAPDQAWIRYQHGGTAWRPCAVLVGHMVENINRVVNRFRPFYSAIENDIPLAKPRYIIDNDQLVLLPSPARGPDELKDPVWVKTNLGPRDAWYFPGTFVANPLDPLELVRLARTVWYQRSRPESLLYWNPEWADRVYRPGTEAFDVLTAVLLGFSSQVHTDGATPVVLVFPLKDEIAAFRDYGSKTHGPLLDVLVQNGVQVVDLTDALGKEARHQDLDTLIGNHLRPQGNEIVARTLAEELPRPHGWYVRPELRSDGVNWRGRKSPSTSRAASVAAKDWWPRLFRCQS